MDHASAHWFQRSAVTLPWRSLLRRGSTASGGRSLRSAAALRRRDQRLPKL